MALITQRLAGIGDGQGDCTLDLTLNDRADRYTQATLTNGMATAATLTVTRLSDGQAWSFTIAAGQTVTQKLPPGLFSRPRLRYPQPGDFAYGLG